MQLSDLETEQFAFMNKVYKIKSTLRSQLNTEFCKPITDHKSFVEIQDNIELLVSMVEMAYGLPYKHDNHTTATNLIINAQLENINARPSLPESRTDSK